MLKHTLCVSLLSALFIAGCGRSDFTAGAGLDEAETGTDATSQNGEEESGSQEGDEGQMPDLPDRAEATNGIPFEGKLIWPLCREDIQAAGVTEGWIYSPEEQAIHGRINHEAIDIAAKYGDPVHAMADGFALATYQTYPIVSQQGEKIGMGGGLMVVIWHEEEVVTQYLHLSGLAPEIPYYNPTAGVTEDGYDSWVPTPIMKPGEMLVAMAAQVKQGDLIGYVGLSGLSANGEEDPVPMPPMIESWDEVHLHIQVHGDRSEDGEKDPKTIYDPTNLYGEYGEYGDVLDVCVGMFACDPNDPTLPLFPPACGE